MLERILRKGIISLCFAFISLLTIYSQNELDTLINRIELSASDTSKVQLVNKVSAELLSSDAEKAHEYAMQALHLADKIGYEAGKARAFYNIAKVYYHQGYYPQALDKFKQSLELEEKLVNKTQIAHLFNQIGNVYMYQADYVLSLDYYLKALRIQEEINDKEGIGATLHNVGNIYYQKFELEQALEYYFKSIEIDVAIDDKKGMANTYINIGATYMDLGKYELAVEYYNRSLKLNEELNNKKNIAFIYNNLASVYDEQGLFKLALEYYNKSLEINKELGSKQGVADTFFSLGSFYSINGRPKKALASLLKSFEISKEIGSLKQMAQSAVALSEAYYTHKNYKYAYEYHVLYKSYQERINNEENVKKMTQLEMQYQFDKKQKEVEFQQKQKELEHKATLHRHRLITGFFIAGFLFMVAFLIVVFRNYKVKKQQNLLLAQQKEEIQEKNNILEVQKGEIHAQKELAESQRDQIEHQKQEITDSIHYASRIQSAILPPEEIISKTYPNYFIIYKPRDIVSGDFYWMGQHENKTIITAADCTGHGVPGAFMSMLGVSFLNDIVNKQNICASDQILNKLREYVIRSLHQTGKKDEAKDGMDLSLVVIDSETKELQFSGAYNPLYIIRDEELIELKADRMPIGIYVHREADFKHNVFQLQDGDSLFMFSDGYIDQFGGKSGKKFKSRPFKQMLMEIKDQPMHAQKTKLETRLAEWQGDYEQVDDILVIGFKI